MVLPLALMAAGGPVGIAAAGLSAVGSLFEGITANSAAKARARQLEMQAQQARQEGGVAAQMGIADDQRMQAHAATLAAANGGGFEGSAMNVLNDLQQQSLFKAKSTVYRAQSQANNADYEASVARQEGKNALISGAIKAGSSLLSGFGQASEAKRAAAAGGG